MKIFQHYRIILILPFFTLAFLNAGCEGIHQSKGLQTQISPTSAGIINGSPGTDSDRITKSVVYVVGDLPENDPKYNVGGSKEASCTGTLVAPRLILTAAHCVLDSAGHRLKRVKVYFSPEGRSTQQAQQSITEVVDLVHHLSFSMATKRFDLALLLLEKAAPEPYVPAEISLMGHDPELPVYSAGFGRTKADTAGSGKLYWARNKIADQEFIKQASQGPKPILYSEDIYNKDGSPFLILDQRDKEKAAICFGDSGGPDYQYQYGKLSIIGVHSFVEGQACFGLAASISLRYYRREIAFMLDVLRGRNPQVPESEIGVQAWSDTRFLPEDAPYFEEVPANAPAVAKLNLSTISLEFRSARLLGPATLKQLRMFTDSVGEIQLMESAVADCSASSLAGDSPAMMAFALGQSKDQLAVVSGFLSLNKKSPGKGLPLSGFLELDQQGTVGLNYRFRGSNRFESARLNFIKCP